MKHLNHHTLPSIIPAKAGIPLEFTGSALGQGGTPAGAKATQFGVVESSGSKFPS
jgi:hypothetical protein